MSKVVKLVFPLLVFLLTLSVYAYTASPTVVPGDSMEMVTAAISLGVPHQPSYPVNTVLGYVASRMEWLQKPSFSHENSKLSFLGLKLSFVPFNIVERVNAAAALLQALVVAVFFLAVVQWLRYQILVSGEKVVGQPFTLFFVATGASLFLAFSLVFWQYATRFEVFPLNNLFLAVLLWGGLRIACRRMEMDHGVRAGDDQRQRRIPWFWYGMALVAGLAVTHHQTIILVVPAMAYLLWREVKGLAGSWLSWGGVAVAVLLGALPFFGLLFWLAARLPSLNWGEVGGLSGALAALVRRDFGTVTSFLVGEEESARPAALLQVGYYLRHVVFDFSILGAGLVALGIWSLWRRARRGFWFATLGVGVGGFLFLSYANFPLADSFSHATLRRFYMLPDMFVALFLASGLYAVLRFFAQIPVSGYQRLGIFLGEMGVVAAFGFPLLTNFSKATLRGNTFTQEYVRDAFGPTEENSLILLSGDIPNMGVDYYRIVELGGADRRITFTPGQFHLSWFLPQLLRRYPDLEIPFPMEGKRFTTTSQVVDANYGKWPIYVGPDLVARDPELEKKYVLYPKHLLFLVKKKGEELPLEEWREENTRLFEEFDKEAGRRFLKRSPSFEETVVFHYVRHFFNVGYVYEEVGLYDDATREYKRAVEIDPAFKEAYAGLARVYGEKKDPPDYYTAIEFLGKYQAVLRKGEEEYGYAARAKIWEYQEKWAKQLEEEASASAKEATEAGEGE